LSVTAQRENREGAMSDVDDREFEQHQWAVEQNLPGAREALTAFINRVAAEAAAERAAYELAGGPVEQPPGIEVIWAVPLAELDQEGRAERLDSVPVAMMVNVDKSLIVSDLFDDAEISAMQTRHRVAQQEYRERFRDRSR